MTRSVRSAKNPSERITDVAESWPSMKFARFWWPDISKLAIVDFSFFLSFFFSRDTFLKVNTFRRKCNSFFVEFMWKFISSKEQLTDKILDKLMDYVSPSKEGDHFRTVCEM